MNQKQKARWERTRAKGKERFILLCGVLFAIVIPFATSVFDHFFSYGGFKPADLMIKVPIFFVAGLVTGAAIWFVTEREYKQGQSAPSSGR